MSTIVEREVEGQRETDFDGHAGPFLLFRLFAEKAMHHRTCQSL